MKKFVVFGLGRSGSTLLVSLLNNHPAIHCDGELFNHNRLHSWRRWLFPIFQHNPVPYLTFRQIANRYYRGAKSYGFKLQPQQMNQLERILPQLHHAGWHILYLQRLSLFDQTISAYVAHHTHRYHGRGGSTDPEDVTLTIEPGQFLGLLHHRQTRTRHCHAIIEALPHLSLVYEHDLQSPQQWDVTIARICDYLGLEPPAEPVTTRLTKPWSRPYSEIITNYAELAELARQMEANA
jgi:LPS sulfotransferase NodH